MKVGCTGVGNGGSLVTVGMADFVKSSSFFFFSYYSLFSFTLSLYDPGIVAQRLSINRSIFPRRSNASINVREPVDA